MTRTARAFMVLLTGVLGSGTSFAVTIHVPSEQPTIQQGIDAASTGDTVLVAADSYSGPLNRNLNFSGKGIVLESEEGAAWTNINCGGVARGFLFNSGEDTTAVVRGIAVFYAAADTGAGVYCTNGSSPKFEDCSFMYCEAQKWGGAVGLYASSSIVRRCYLRHNSAEDSGGLNGFGGGIACFAGSSPLIAGTGFRENHALQAGGGIYSLSSSPTLIDCELQENTLGDYGQGAGAAVYQSNGTSFTDCVFIGNGIPTCVGGGLHGSGSTLDVTDCDFLDNTSGASGGIHLTAGATANVSGCTFVGNAGNWSAAGALQCVSTANAVVSNCTFVRNGANHVWLDGTSPTLENCILAFSTSGLAVYCETGAETPHIHHCFVFQNEEGDSLCGGNVHDIEYTDPLLCDFPSGDVTLCADSPCLPGVTWPQLVGAEGQGCGECGSVVHESTWGRVKAEYR
jgi:hypothetical protein